MAAFTAFIGVTKDYFPFKPASPMRKVLRASFSLLEVVDEGLLHYFLALFSSSLGVGESERDLERDEVMMTSELLLVKLSFLANGAFFVQSLVIGGVANYPRVLC